MSNEARAVAERIAQARRDGAAEALDEAADDFAVIPHPYEGGVTAWLRNRAAVLRDEPTP